MNADVRDTSKQDHLWVYAVLPVVIINLVSCGIFGAYGFLQATQAERAAQIPLGQLSFGLSAFIFILEWVLAVSIILAFKRQHTPLRTLIAPEGKLLGFRWGPGLLVFVAFNVLWVAYFYALRVLGMPTRIEGLAAWQVVFYVALLPITAGFCEELIWRGYIITRLEARGRRPWAAILLSAISFALIHGIFFPGKLLVTFLTGILAGLYFVRERNLVPLMIAHAVVDVWAFALSVMGVL